MVTHQHARVREFIRLYHHPDIDNTFTKKLAVEASRRGGGKVARNSSQCMAP